MTDDDNKTETETNDAANEEKFTHSEMMLAAQLADQFTMMRVLIRKGVVTRQEVEDERKRCLDYMVDNVIPIVRANLESGASVTDGFETEVDKYLDGNAEQ